MNVLLYIAGALAFLLGLLPLVVAKGVIHEIQAFVMFVIAAILITGGGIIGALHKIYERLVRDDRKQAASEQTARNAAIVKAQEPPVVPSPRQVNPKAP